MAKNPFVKFYHAVLTGYHKIPVLLRDILVTGLCLTGAYYASAVLSGHTGSENNSALVFVLAVAIISLMTTGYFYGIVASLVGTYCINYYFMLPYAEFNLSRSGYPVAMLSMLAVSCIVCALTGRVKQQAAEATRREQRTRDLFELNEKLNEENAAIQMESARETIRGNILRAVSHDLRTPLTSISGAASVLLSSSDVSPKNIAMLKDIKEDADGLIVMVENILSVTRIQEGSMALKTQDEMLEEVAGAAALTTRKRFPQCKIDLDLSEDILYLPMDPMLIKQVIVNLLENAVRHSGTPDRIRLHLFRQGDWAVVEVRDHGKGLSPEILDTIRQGKPMPRDRTGDQSRGMGIGLSACQSIIQAHGGIFKAENAPDGGAVFRFGLPIKEVDYENE